MMSREKTPRYKTPEWLRNHGCACDWVEEPGAEPDLVDIWIDPTPPVSLAFRIAPGQTASYLWAQFAARTAQVHMAEVCFELCDAPDLRFELLPRPGLKREPYRFAGGGLEMPQEQVVNAFFSGTLYQHHPLEGYLMGVAYQPLPGRLMGRLPAELSVINEHGDTVGSTKFEIPLDPNEHGKRYAGRKGKGVFEPLDDNEEPVISEMPLPRKQLIVPEKVSLVSATETAGQSNEDGNGTIRPRN